MTGRSLRPRGTVDYTEKVKTTSTPKWLKSRQDREEASVEAKSVGQAKLAEQVTNLEKENEQPAAKDNRQGAARQAAGKGKADSKPASSLVSQAAKRKAAAEGGKVKASKQSSEEGKTAETTRKSELEAPKPLARPRKRLTEQLSPTNKDNSTAIPKGRKRPAEAVSDKEEGDKPKKKAKFKSESSKRPTGDVADVPSVPANAAQKQDSVKQTCQRKTRSNSQKGTAEATGREPSNTEASSLDAEAKSAATEAVDKHSQDEKSQKKTSGKAAAKTKGAQKLSKALQAPDAAPELAGRDEMDPPAVPTSENFKALQEEYSALFAKYVEVKAQRIQDVEGAIQEIRTQEQVQSRRAVQLAAHWEAEAQRQAAIAQHGDVAALRKELEGVLKEASEAKQLLLNREAKIVEREEEIAELKRRLGEMLRLVEMYQDTLPQESDIAEDELGLSDGPGGSAGVRKRLRSQPASGTAAQSVQATPASVAQVQSLVSSAKSLQMRPSGGDAADFPEPERFIAATLNLSSYEPSPVASPVAAAAVQHIHEAAACCPEGASLTEPYIPPAGTLIGGISNRQVNCNLSAKPLVPYALGASVNQRSAKSRFAAKATRDVPNEAEPTANKVALSVEQAPAADQLGLQDYHGQSVAQSQQDGAIAGETDSPAIGRQLAFTPGKIAPKAAAVVAVPATAGTTQGSQGPSAEPANPELVEPQAVDINGSASNVSHTEPISTTSNITNKGLMNLVGLTVSSERPHGGFSYTHPPTKFVFEIKDDTDSEDEGPLLVFNPLEFGEAESLLPPYLRYEIKFAPDMRMKLVSRIMEHLGKTGAAGH